MSERLHNSHEKHTVKVEAESESQRNLERLQKEAARQETASTDLDQLRQKVTEHAISGKEVGVHEQQEASQTPLGVQRELKNTAYVRSLQHARASLAVPERALSRVIHQPVVEKLSNAGAQTIARPSGILGGGIAALIGSSLLLFIAKRYGFEYNNLVFFLLFVGGFVAGLAVEAIIKFGLRKRQTD